MGDRPDKETCDVCGCDMTEEDGVYCEYCNTYMCDDCDVMAYEQGEENSGWGPSLHCCPKHAPK